MKARPKKLRLLKKFVVASASENLNSFGLRGYVLVARNGEAWEVGHSDYPRWRKWQDLQFPISGRRVVFVGCEIPRRLPDAPKAVSEEIFGRREQPKKT